MRPLVRLLPVLGVLALSPIAVAQTGLDSAAVVGRFRPILAAAHADRGLAAAPLVACPVPDADGDLGPGLCDPALLEHRVQVEWQLALLRRLVPPAARPVTFTAGQRSDAGLYVLRFQAGPSAQGGDVFLITAGGALRLAAVEVEEPLADVPTPAELGRALDQLLARAADPATTPAAFAPLLVATGGDRMQARRAAADAADPAQRQAIEGSLAGIRRLLAGSTGHSVAGFVVEYESEGAWHILTVLFDGRNGADDAHVMFAFLAVGDAFLLGDMDVD
ncbi:MAG TPA: hypothetical protein VK610_05465 [Rhodothermales bacterium]|nr:hypothetical protein [Rhodothermales bacterium]